MSGIEHILTLQMNYDLGRLVGIWIVLDGIRVLYISKTDGKLYRHRLSQPIEGVQTELAGGSLFVKVR